MGTVHKLATAPQGVTLGEAVSAYLATLGRAESTGTRRVYSIPLHALERHFGADAAVDGIDPDELAGWFTQRWGEYSPARWNVCLNAIRSAAHYWAEQGWAVNDPTVRLRRRKVSPDRDRALSREQIAGLLARENVSLRDKTLWCMLYESAARAEEVLSLNVEDLDRPNNRARVVRKGGAQDVITWQTKTAMLLARLLKGRTSGPVFLTDRRARVPLPAGDIDQASGKARLSYDRAKQIFQEAAGATLHQLRHSKLTHMAEDGASTPMLMAKSGHTSVRSLAKYARVSAQALQEWETERDPAARRRSRL